MAQKKRAADDPLFATAWVQVFEEDAAGRTVFRPEDADIPLSRRPRERIELRDDGSARLWMPGPDDRFYEQPANWTQQKDEVVLRTDQGTVLRIVDESSRRLIVEILRAPMQR